MIGQEQDALGGEFTASESFIGQLTQLNMWSSQLSLRDIEALRIQCEGTQGDVIAWTDIAGAVRGSVSEKPIEFCKGNLKARRRHYRKGTCIPITCFGRS